MKGSLDFHPLWKKNFLKGGKMGPIYDLELAHSHPNLKRPEAEFFTIDS